MFFFLLTFQVVGGAGVPVWGSHNSEKHFDHIAPIKGSTIGNKPENSFQSYDVAKKAYKVILG